LYCESEQYGKPKHLLRSTSYSKKNQKKPKKTNQKEKQKNKQKKEKEKFILSAIEA